MNDKTPLIIADTYKIIGKIASGGSGTIYLAEHLRLNKNVVLKADNRILSAKPETLRREVDALKNINHAYIPQVYDFIVEEGTTYTVINYIDGESFDKPLKRGQRFTQAQVIEWACQLLEALAYLHSRPPHGILHADIKPSNVMLTPQGDVRLIDFNIALALGEEGAIAVGRSFGYASPEHYGIDYSSSSKTIGIITDVKTDISQDTFSDPETLLEDKSKPGSNESTSGRKTIMLDVRSDIYSLGATLYHILTGERPAQKATDVKPISSGEYSSVVTDIIEKAMNPDPDLRYQSAEEMLRAFKSLRENDPRYKKYRRNLVLTLISSILLLTVGGFITFVGLKQMEQLQSAYVLSEYSGNALRAGDINSALVYALQALPEKRNIFTPPNSAEAQKALADALNIYDLSDGFKAYGIVDLPSAPLYVQISPDGKTAAVIYAYNIAIIDMDNMKIIATFPAESSALSEVKYIDENSIVYAGGDGVKVYDIAKNVELWAGKPATSVAVPANAGVLAAMHKDEDIAMIYNMENGGIIREINFNGKYQRTVVNDSFANPNDNLFSINSDGTLLGVSFADGSLWVYNLNDNGEDLELFDSSSGYVHFEGGFFERYFAFSATNPSSSVFAVIDTVEQVQTGGFESLNPFGVQVDESGIYVQTENILVKIHPETGEQEPLVDTNKNIFQFARSGNHVLLATDGGCLFFDKAANLIDNFETEYDIDFVQIANEIAVIGSMDIPYIQIMKLESYSDEELFSYDPSYCHDEARLSSDRKTVMLFSYDQIYLYDIKGDLIVEKTIPNAEQVYDQQYFKDKDGSRLEVIYNDGTTHAYSAGDATLLYERKGERPDLTLYEEFLTDTLRIESPLHGVPVAYDKKSGKLVKELERDAYLTYVTQVDKYIIIEYITAEGFRYGLLLNDKCEKLAYLPYLCDIVENELIFDYPTGNLRKSRIYHINELIELARKQIN